MIKKECCGKEFFEEDEHCTECGKVLVAIDVCDSCGEPLTEDSKDVCLVCGAEQAEIPGYEEDVYQPIVTPEDGEAVEDLSDSVVFQVPVKKPISQKMILTIWASVATAAAVVLAVLFIVLPIFTNTVVGKWYLNSTSTAAAQAVILDIKNNKTYTLSQGSEAATPGKYTLSKKSGEMYMKLTFTDTKNGTLEGPYFFRGKTLYFTIQSTQGEQTVKFVKK